MRRVCAVLLVLLLAALPAGRAEGDFLWLDGDFHSAESDDVIQREESGIYGYSKNVSWTELQLSCTGYRKADMVLSLEELLAGASSVEALPDVSVGDYPAQRRRFVRASEGEETRWDMLLVDAGEFSYGVSLLIPLERAEDYDERIERVIGALSLRDAPRDKLPMLTADLSGFELEVDELYTYKTVEPSRSILYLLGGKRPISAAVIRSVLEEDEFPADSSSFESLRESFLDDGAKGLTEIEIEPVSGFPVERWRYTHTMPSGITYRTDAVFVIADSWAYMAMVDLGTEPTPEYEEIVENLIHSLHIA